MTPPAQASRVTVPLPGALSTDPHQLQPHTGGCTDEKQDSCAGFELQQLQLVLICHRSSFHPLRISPGARSLLLFSSKPTPCAAKPAHVPEPGSKAAPSLRLCQAQRLPGAQRVEEEPSKPSTERAGLALTSPLLTNLTAQPCYKRRSDCRPKPLQT